MNINGEFYSYKKSEGNGYNQSLKNCIEKACRYCLDVTNSKDLQKQQTPIMLLGKIQSGKTRAYTGLIALAFDNEFDMVFILTKNSKPLAKQTVSRMQQEFKGFIKNHKIVVSDIMKSTIKMSGYELNQKNIIVAKKEKNNITKLMEFIEKNSIGEKIKCLIIDDEADTTGIGYDKKKGEDEYTLRVIAKKVNDIRGTLSGCAFVEVTATPYALYLQPEFDENSGIHPIKPLDTILVPYGKDYIGGDYYFIEGKKEKHPASMLFEPIDSNEHDIVSDQKRKGKKSKLEDKRVFKENEILIKKDKLPVFKKGLINFFIGVIALTYNEGFDNQHFAYVIHTATQKGSHFNLQNISEIFLEQIKERTDETEPLIENLLSESYIDIKKSINAYGLKMPTYSETKQKFFNVIDNDYYSISVVNSDNDVEALLDEESGELKLCTPYSVFIGGQALDRGVTIPNMIGFYYGRNPKTMQQDTVLQHSRMFGYRKKLLPVTRFYTTERIHSNMEKITEIDISLREDIENEKQGNGVYFITRKDQSSKYGTGYIKPCSPDKIRLSDIQLLKSYKRILPVGFTPVCKTEFLKIDKKIENLLLETQKIEKETYTLNLSQAEELLNLIYKSFDRDEENDRFVPLEEMLTYMRYFVNEDNKIVNCVIFRDRDNAKYRQDGRLHDSPFTSQGEERSKIERMAEKHPCISLYKEKGTKEGWQGRAFWWPVLVAPKNVPKTIYASKTDNTTT